MSHDQIGQAVRCLADVVNGADVGVVECRRGAGFLEEAALRGVIPGEIRREYFDGDTTTQACVARPVNDSHSAGAQRGFDFIGAKLGTRCKGRHRVAKGRQVTFAFWRSPTICNEGRPRLSDEGNLCRKAV